MDWPSVPKTAFDSLDRELNRYKCEAFVHVGNRFDDLLRYLTRFYGPDRPYAFASVGGKTVLCTPSLFGEQGRREFVGDVVRTPAEQAETSPTGRAIEAIKEFGGADRVLVSDAIPHRTYARLSEEMTVVVADDLDVGRATKSETERACHAATQAAVQRGMARAEEILAEAVTDGDTVLWDGVPLTTERLRREVNARLASHGVTDAENTVIGAGKTCADLHFVGEDDIGTGETVILDISPRGPHGYYGDFTRTFVVGDVGDWERDTYAAVREAQDAALSALEGGAGTPAGEVHEAAASVIEDRGYETGNVQVGFYHGTGHGVGVSLHEEPGLSGDAALEAGNVITIEPGIYDPSRGGVRIEDLVVVTEDGYENLTNYPRSITPEPDVHEW